MTESKLSQLILVSVVLLVVAEIALTLRQVLTSFYTVESWGINTGIIAAAIFMGMFFRTFLDKDEPLPDLQTSVGYSASQDRS